MSLFEDVVFREDETNNKPPAFNVVNSKITEDSGNDFIEIIEPEKQ